MSTPTNQAFLGSPPGLEEPFPTGPLVEAHSLSAAAFNGLQGRVVGTQGDRYRIRFAGATGEKALKPANLKLIEEDDLSSSQWFPGEPSAAAPNATGSRELEAAEPSLRMPGAPAVADGAPPQPPPFAAEQAETAASEEMSRTEEIAQVGSRRTPSTVEIAATYVGTVKSFNEETGFGFISCEATFQMFQRDVFLHHKQMQAAVAVTVGDRVGFALELNRKGQPQARQVYKLGIAELGESNGGASSAAPAGPPMARPAGDDGKSSHMGTQEPFPAGALVEAHSLSAAALNGLQGRVVGPQGDRYRIHFAGATGEKALKPANLKLIEEDDLSSSQWFPGEPTAAAPNATGSREVETAEPSLRMPCVPAVADGAPSQPPPFAAEQAETAASEEMSRTEEIAQVGSRRTPSAADMAATYVGTVKFFNEETGFGFISCEATFQIFQRDVFLHHKQMQAAVGVTVGDRVGFALGLNRKGQPQARQVCKLGIAEIGESNGGASSAAPADPAMARPAEDDGASSHMGTQEPFPAGALVEAHSLSAAALNGLQGRVVGPQGYRYRIHFAGATGEKALKPANLKLIEEDDLSSSQWFPGEPTAAAPNATGSREVETAEPSLRMPCAPAVADGAPPQPPPFAAEQAETAASEEMSRTEEIAQVGSRRTPSAAELAATYVGTVKSFNEETGFGLISCEATFQMFQRDVFLQHKQKQAAVEVTVGDRVGFALELNRKGQPQARQVCKLGTAEIGESNGGASSAAPADPAVARPAGDDGESSHMGTQVVELRYHPTDMKPLLLTMLGPIVEKLSSADGIQNEHLMRCVASIFSYLKNDAAHVALQTLAPLRTILLAQSGRPSNTGFSYHLFETIATVVQVTAPSHPHIVEATLFPALVQILSNNDRNLWPSTFAILGLILETSPNANTDWRRLFPLILTEDLWLTQANILGLVRLLRAYIARHAAFGDLFQLHVVDVLNRFALLWYSEQTQSTALELLSAIFKHLPIEVYQAHYKTIFTVILAKLHTSQSPKLLQNFVITTSIFIHKNGGHLFLAVINEIQQGLLVELVTSIWFQACKMSLGWDERKICAVGLCKLIGLDEVHSDPVAMQGCCDALVHLLNLTSSTAVPLFADASYEERPPAYGGVESDCGMSFGRLPNTELPGANGIASDIPELSATAKVLLTPHRQAITQLARDSTLIQALEDFIR